MNTGDWSYSFTQPDGEIHSRYLEQLFMSYQRLVHPMDRLRNLNLEQVDTLRKQASARGDTSLITIIDMYTDSTEEHDVTMLHMVLGQTTCLRGDYHGLGQQFLSGLAQVCLLLLVGQGGLYINSFSQRRPLDVVRVEMALYPIIDDLLGQLYMNCLLDMKLLFYHPASTAARQSSVILREELLDLQQGMHHRWWLICMTLVYIWEKVVPPLGYEELFSALFSVLVSLPPLVQEQAPVFVPPIAPEWSIEVPVDDVSDKYLSQWKATYAFQRD